MGGIFYKKKAHPLLRADNDYHTIGHNCKKNRQCSHIYVYKTIVLTACQEKARLSFFYYTEKIFLAQ